VGALWTAAAVAVAGCSGNEPTLPEPVEVETCDELVDVSVQLVEVWVDVVARLPVDQLLADTPPAEFEELAAIGVELDERASRLGCDPAQINADAQARLAEEDTIETTSPVAQMVLDLVSGGVVGQLPPPPATTVPPVTEG
jgi:hypothetical protein